ncbi:CehA/McbA family metallohydrolase [Allokutzneria oryzae]|uniref:CehA/McbA family metallohydrolase n=1 Tax=Allokutzneria oryzae TaxID=1378989 RepID=A0ABV6A8R9_9PSEU
MTVHSGRWVREDRAARMWPGLAFEVPVGAPAVTVELEFDDSSGAVIDLGCEGAAGWRGWSGGARRSFTITRDWATPGYLPGELEPGPWHVVLGLHRVPVDGVDYRVTVSFAPVARPSPMDSPKVPQRPPVRDLPAAPGLRWVPADFHSHTLHSDGALTVPELAALAVSRGLSALAVTDHNTVSHHAELAEVGQRYGIALVPGQEVTTESGHANAFGDIGWIDFRRPAVEWLSTVEERGGLLSVNHPLGADCSWRHPLPRRAPLAEVWHSSWLDPRWGGPLAWWQAWGREVTPIGGSDWHRSGSDAIPGTPTTWVAVDAAASGPGELALAVLDGLRAGRTAVSAGLDAPVLLPVDGELVAVDADGTLVIDAEGSRRPVRGASCTLPAGAEGGMVLFGHDSAVVSICAAP